MTDCLLETIRELEIKNGDTYFFEEELRDGLRSYFGILTDDNLPNIFLDLQNQLDYVRDKSMVIVDRTKEIISEELISFFLFVILFNNIVLLLFKLAYYRYILPHF